MSNPCKEDNTLFLKNSQSVIAWTNPKSIIESDQLFDIGDLFNWLRFFDKLNNLKNSGFVFGLGNLVQILTEPFEETDFH